jgi:hypothetical protein
MRAGQPGTIQKRRDGVFNGSVLGDIMKHPILRGWLSEITNSSVRDRMIISEIKDYNYPERGDVPLAIHLSTLLGADDSVMVRCQSFGITLTAKPNFKSNCWVVVDHAGRRRPWEMDFEDFPTIVSLESRMVAIAEAINREMLGAKI